ncbi:50s ribosomal protein l21 [Holotrichia oblita]|uniref:50s ribosomal protein l21 n=1 Tax=Holotrichia oblita TaxID=644536 RepID=A0ACB9TA74_HOLOL|nr:50s ribosomal protein l21 [Holotrichia oblita]
MYLLYKISNFLVVVLEMASKLGTLPGFVECGLVSGKPIDIESERWREWCLADYVIFGLPSIAYACLKVGFLFQRESEAGALKVVALCSFYAIPKLLLRSTQGQRAEPSAQVLLPSEKKIGLILDYDLRTEIDSMFNPEEVIEKVNKQIAANEQGRLFAVVQIAGKQFKVTAGDVVVIEGYWPPTVGDKISLDKVLLVGGLDFSLIGKPLVERGLIDVHATVIEKTLSHTKTHFRKKRRKQYKRINCIVQQTMLRINKVQVIGQLNNPPSVIEVAHTTPTQHS